MSKQVEVWRFEWYDPIRRKRFRSPYKATLEDIARHDPPATAIAGTNELREILDPEEFSQNSAAHLLRGPASK